MNIKKAKQIINFIENLNPVERNFLTSLIFSEVRQSSKQTIEQPVIKQIRLQGKKRRLKHKKRNFNPKGRNMAFVTRANAAFKALQDLGSATVQEVKNELASKGTSMTYAMADTALLYLLKIKPSVKMRWENGKKRLFYIQKTGY